MEEKIRWVDEAETAEITGRAIQSLRNDRFKGRGIPYSKVGRSVRYSLKDICKFMESKRVETRPI